MPPLPQEVEMEEDVKTLENDKSFLKPDWGRHTFLMKNQHLHQRNFLRSIQQPSESPKAPSSILSVNSPHNKFYLLLYNQLLYATNSTRPNSTSPLNVWYQSQVKPSHKPLEAGIRVKTLCRQPHCSVGPTTGITLPEEGEQKKALYKIWKLNVSFLKRGNLLATEHTLG